MIIHGGIASHCCNYEDWSQPVNAAAGRSSELELQPSTVDDLCQRTAMSALPM